MNGISLMATDIESYLNQMVAQLMTGEESPTDFDAFVQALNERGLTRLSGILSGGI